MPRPKNRFTGHKNLDAFRRITRIKDVKQTILIVCEGTKTEPNYFKGFRVSSAHVKIVGEGLSPEGIVRKAIEINTASEESYDQVWCVFDRDDCSRNNFNNATQIANSKNFYLACSIEAFELWYVLHFIYLDAALQRDRYFEILDRHLRTPYQKNCQTMYEDLLELQDIAIRNGKRLLREYSNPIDYDNSPSTTVFKLVEALNKYI